MSALDKFYDFTLNLPDAKLTSKAMNLCNIDRNVFNIYLTLQEGKNNPILNADLGDYTVTMIVVKPKTKEYVEKVGVVDGSNDRLLFELGDTFNDQIGSYKGEIKVQNGNEVITSSSFAYTVTQSLISGLNAEIEANPDVEILRQLINEVKAVVGMAPGDPDSLLTEYQKKTDNTLTTTEKEIPKAINEVNSQIKDMAKDVLLEDGKLYLKKSDGTKLGTGVILPVSGGGGSVTWESLTGKPATFAPSSHSHSKSDITDFPTIPTVSNDLTNALKANYDSAYTHSTSAHAPSTAQKNSDITKEEIEAKLTGEISTHSHANSGSIKNEWVTLINKKISVESVNSILENFILDGNYNYFKIYITRTSNESNTVSSLSLKRIIVNGIDCGGFIINFGNPQTEKKEIFVSVHKLNNLIDWSYRVNTNSLEYNQSNMTHGLSRNGINSSYLNKLYVEFNDVYTGDINIIVEGGVV